MDERHEQTSADRLARIESRMERHELDNLSLFRLTLAVVSIAVALIGLAILRLAVR